MKFAPEKAKWDIKKPENYPEDHGEESCSKFLDRVAEDIKFDFEESAFHSAVGDKASFFSHVCDSEAKALQMIERVGEIIKALLDRAKLIPGLIHSNNMLWRRGELLRRLLEHYANLAAKLEEEMRVLLNQLAYMAYQVHTLMNALNIQYNPATGELTDNKGEKVDRTREELLGIDDRMKDLLEILGSIASGTLYGQKLMLESHPRFSMKFKGTELDSVDQDALKQEIGNMLSETMTALGGTAIDSSVIQGFTRFKAGSLIVLVQLDDKYVAESGITEDQRKILQMAMFQIAFTTPDTSKYPLLDGMYKKELPRLPDFEIPGLVPIPENAPEEWKQALEHDFGMDLSKLKSPGKSIASKPKSGDDAGGKKGVSEEEARAGLPETKLGSGGLVVDGEISADAKALAVYNALIAKNPGLEAKLSFDAFKKSGVYAGAVAVRKRGSARRSVRRSARRGSGRRRTSARRGQVSKYHGNFFVDFVALGVILTNLGLDGSALIPITAADVLAAIESIKEDAASPNAALLAEINGVKDKAKDLVKDSTTVVEKVPLITKLAAAAKPAGGEEEAAPEEKESDREMVAGAESVKLEAVVDKKAELLAKIKKMAQSSEVKEFIRVRPYNDKDTRATELQLGTVGQTYDRSPDPKVVQGQLATLVDYTGSCLGFTKLFEKGKDDMFFDKFQSFIPKGKSPPKSEWFSTVNGGVFFEPMSYLDPKRSADGKEGIAVVKTDMLRVRKQVRVNIKYGWVKEDNKTPTTNDDPDKARILAITPKAETIKELEAQLKSVPAFKDLFNLWSDDIESRNREIEKVLGETKDSAKQTALKAAAAALPKPTEVNFLDEYYKNRTLSEAINGEFVDTVWPVLQIYFGLKLEDGTRSPDTKNIVTFFYGASGSGKTFSAEAILKKCFDEIREHKDEFQLKIISDYNDDLFDYYSTAANLKRKQNDLVMASKSMSGKPIGDKKMRLQQFAEMAERAKFLGWREGDGGVPPKVFWEGNPSPFIKEKEDKSMLDKLGTYMPMPESLAGLNLEMDLKAATDNSAIFKDIKKVATLNIPKEAAAFEKFQIDFEKRVVAFRSVTDTGLNPESSRSHLLYIIVRKTKNGEKMDSKDRGAQFILADFAGTEDLNYLMTEEAWKIWIEWAKSQKLPADQVEGNCKVAGKDVKRDWACLDLPALANAKGTGKVSADPAVKASFRKALVDGWKNIKIKTLVAKDISEDPAPPKDIAAYKDELTKKWQSRLNMPFIAGEDGPLGPAGTYITQAEFDAKFKTITEGRKANIEDNPNRFRIKDAENDDVICNMVLAMHAESKHINDSLREITDLVKAQRQAIDKDPAGKADVESMKKSKVLSKKMVTEILATAVTAGSAAVTIGAMNPRRANDWETYKTMVNITAMEAACKAK